MLLVGSPEDEVYERDWSEEPTGVAPSSEGIGGRLEASGARPVREDPSQKKRVQVAVDPRKQPKGILLLTVLGPDDEPIDSAALRVFVEPVRKGAFPTQLGRYDEQSRTWRFGKVPSGRVNVRLYSDHIVRVIQTVTVAAKRENKTKIKIEPAGAIAYDVIAYDKTRPKKVKLTLYDATDKPTKAWYQVRTSRSLNTPREAKTITQGPEGVLLGVLPGRYRLKVTSEHEEWDEAVVNVVAGATQKVSLEVRR